MPKHSFQKGNKCAKGGRRPNSGRPSDEFRTLCGEALNEVDGIGLVKSIIAGVKFDGPFGKASAKPETRFECVKWLAERTHGKAMQPLEHSGPDGEALTVKLVNYGDNHGS